MANLALADLIAPYILRGDNLGAWHAALSVIRVTRYETASDDFGVALRGHAEFNGQGLVDIGSGSLSIAGQSSEAAPPFDPNRKIRSSISPKPRSTSSSSSRAPAR